MSYRVQHEGKEVEIFDYDECRKAFEDMGKTIDYDVAHGNFGKCPDATVPFLSKEPTNFEEAAWVMFHTLRSIGVTLARVEGEENPQVLLNAAAIRMSQA